MISKNKIKYLHSLEAKKGRDADNVFVAEGPKVVGDILNNHPEKLRKLIATEVWLRANRNVIKQNVECEMIEVTQEELSKASFLCSPQQVMAVFEKLGNTIDRQVLSESLSLLIDGVQDPGNLGTIIRVADWFGIENVLCSHSTVDCYNPKVVQSTMGSIARVNVVYCDIKELIASMPNGFPIYGTLLEGENMYEKQLSSKGFIVMGNEGKGLSVAVREMVTEAIRIPNFPESRKTADSLNVAIATAVVCAEFRRRQV